MKGTVAGVRSWLCTTPAMRATSWSVCFACIQSIGSRITTSSADDQALNVPSSSCHEYSIGRRAVSTPAFSPSESISVRPSLAGESKWTLSVGARSGLIPPTPIASGCTVFAMSFAWVSICGIGLPGMPRFPKRPR